MDKWQQDWTNPYKASWTYRIIPVIGEWTKKKHGKMKF